MNFLRFWLSLHSRETEDLIKLYDCIRWFYRKFASSRHFKRNPLQTNNAKGNIRCIF